MGAHRLRHTAATQMLRAGAPLTEIAALFSDAPRFQINEQRGAGHNISLGHTAAAYHSTVFSFAGECVGTQTPGTKADLEAG